MATFTNKSVSANARRVYFHILPHIGDALMKQFNLTEERFQQQIKDGCKTTGMNAKQIADVIIKTWNEQQNQL